MQQRAAEKRLLSRQRARKRHHLAELRIVYKFDKVEYVSTAVPRVPSVLKRHYILVEKA